MASVTVDPVNFTKKSLLLGRLAGEISYKATRQRGFPNFPTKLEFHTAMKKGFVQDSVWHAAQQFFKDMPRNREKNLCQFMIEFVHMKIDKPLSKL